MKTAKLIKQGKGWQLAGEKTLPVTGDFGLTDDMNGQEVEFDNSGGPVKVIRFNGKDYTKQQTQQQDMAKYQKHYGNERHGKYQQQGNRGNQGGGGRQNEPARAPYNFVPLNDIVVPAETGVGFDSFAEGRLSGYIELEVKALSPLFIKGHDGEFFRANENLYIPGSSIRGLTRHILEIASYSALTIFEDKVFYRRSTLTDDGDKVYAGFMRYMNGGYLIFPGNAKQEPSSDIRQAYKYKFSNDACTFSTGKFGHRLIVWKINISEGIEKPVPSRVIKSYQSDNTRSEQAIDLIKSLRKGLILNSIGEKINRETIEIPKELGIPVFYRLNDNGTVYSIGHAKYHRMPYSSSVSDHVHQTKLTNGFDFAASIFGTTEHASKVFFEDLHPLSEVQTVLDEAKHPKILSSPKPTTYQHYLEQQKGVSPKKWSDAGVPIRGFKNYWHRKTSSDLRDPHTWIETKKEITKSHHPPINPVSQGSVFGGKIRFENLTRQELGALLLSLDLPQGCGHKLGLGKPLGLGSIQIVPNLTLINRKARYAEVFDSEATWSAAEELVEKMTPYEDAFAKYIAKHTQQQIDDSNSYWEKDARMKELKHMLTLEQMPGRVSWENRTRYMEIERNVNEQITNEYKYRPILPPPLRSSKTQHIHQRLTNHDPPPTSQRSDPSEPATDYRAPAGASGVGCKQRWFFEYSRMDKKCLRKTQEKAS
ncbi:MAG: TIGR03986 family CRISPR-associated RAMP protein [Saprospiraceae bacterium]|nr:TIGR03986 family CRISPR-associated RAMP protein [Saprospiraceae bacterium]